MKELNIEGIFPPIATPFADGAVAHDRLRENLDRWNKTQLAGYVIFGSNGESVHLDQEEKLAIVDTVKQHLPQGKLLIAGTGCQSTAATVRLTNLAAERGADAALVVTPHYYKAKMDAGALQKHYLSIADQADIPIMIYNVPQFTGINVSPGLVASSAEHPNIIGIKDSSGNIAQVGEMIATTPPPPSFHVLAGSAGHLLPALALGASGGILALANVAPEECCKIFQDFHRGKHTDARELQLKLLAANKAVTAGFGVAGLKAALDMVGYFGGDPRPPLLPLGEVQRNE
ncbi:MAG: dihydrodipicolinate synthase family protein, partial [Thermodesulfobacteriota bacterium]